MAKLPSSKASEAIRALKRLGCVQIRQNGSHVILQKQILVQQEGREQIRTLGCVVPLHHRELAIGTLNSILRQANISTEEFIQSL